MKMELNQQDNKLIINGYLKSKNLRHIQMKSGSDAIVGSVDIGFLEGKKHNVQRVNVFATETTKSGKDNPSYKSIEKVENDFVAAEDDKANADRVHVSGRLDYNVFTTKQGTLVKTLRKNGAFFSRISRDNKKYKDEARANVVLTVTGYEDEIKDDQPTGNKIIHNLNVGYGNRINTIPNLKFNMKSLGDDIDTIVDTFPVGTTINTQIAFQDYALVKKSTKQAAHGFGNHEQMSVATQFVHNALIDYIDIQPVSETEKRKQALDKSQVKHAEDLLKQRVEQENDNNNNSKPSNPFASKSKTKVASGNNKADDISDDDLPF